VCDDLTQILTSAPRRQVRVHMDVITSRADISVTALMVRHYSPTASPALVQPDLIVVTYCIRDL